MSIGDDYASVPVRRRADGWNDGVFDRINAA